MIPTWDSCGGVKVHHVVSSKYERTVDTIAHAARPEALAWDLESEDKVLTTVMTNTPVPLLLRAEKNNSCEYLNEGLSTSFLCALMIPSSRPIR